MKNSSQRSATSSTIVLHSQKPETTVEKPNSAFDHFAKSSIVSKAKVSNNNSSQLFRSIQMYFEGIQEGSTRIENETL